MKNIRKLLQLQHWINPMVIKTNWDFCQVMVGWAVLHLATATMVIVATGGLYAAR